MRSSGKEGERVGEDVSDEIVGIDARQLGTGRGRLEDTPDERAEAITAGHQALHTRLEEELVYRDDQQTLLPRS